MARKNIGFEVAEECFAEYGINVKEAIDAALEIPVSVHCWQGDDVGGFETWMEDLMADCCNRQLSRKSKNSGELRADEQVLSYCPAKQGLTFMQCMQSL